MTAKLNDAAVLEALRGWGSQAMTYVIANRLNRKWPTSTIRRRLQSMEKRGVVKRMPTSYATQICWAPTDGADSATGKGQDPQSSREQKGSE